MVVVDHDTGALVWAKSGRDAVTVQAFFAELGPGRCARIKLISADAAEWIATVAKVSCPNAVRCMDPLCELPRNGSYVQARIMSTQGQASSSPVVGAVNW